MLDRRSAPPSRDKGCGRLNATISSHAATAAERASATQWRHSRQRRRCRSAAGSCRLLTDPGNPALRRRAAGWCWRPCTTPSPATTAGPVSLPADAGPDRHGHDGWAVAADTNQDAPWDFGPLTVSTDGAGTLVDRPPHAQTADGDSGSPATGGGRRTRGHEEPGAPTGPQRVVVVIPATTGRARGRRSGTTGDLSRPCRRAVGRASERQPRPAPATASCSTRRPSCDTHQRRSGSRSSSPTRSPTWRARRRRRPTCRSGWWRGWPTRSPSAPTDLTPGPRALPSSRRLS